MMIVETVLFMCIYKLVLHSGYILHTCCYDYYTTTKKPNKMAVVKPAH